MKTKHLLRSVTLRTMLVCIAAGTFANLHAQNFDLRIAHLIPGSPAKIDVFLNGRTTASVVNLPYENASAVLPRLSGGTGSFSVAVSAAGAGVGSALTTKNVTISGISEYIAVAYGPQAQPKLAVMQRDATIYPAQGNALLNVLNASGISGKLDIYLTSVTGTPLFPALPQDGYTGFIEVTGQPVTMFITAEGSKTPIARLITPLNDAAYRTIIITGNNAASLKAYALNGENPDLHEMPTLQQATAEGVLPTLRAVNLLPNSTVPRIDVYMNGQIKSHALNYHSASEAYGPLTLDSATVLFTPVNEGTQNPLLTVNVQLRRDTNYLLALTHIASGAPTPILLRTAAKEPAPDADKWKLRVANASPFYSDVKVVIKYTGGDQTLNSVKFRQASEWLQVPAGSAITIEAYQNGESTPFMTSKGSYSGAAGSIQTLFLVGGELRLETDIVNESELATQAPMTTLDGPRAGLTWAATGTAPVAALVPNPVTTQGTLRYNLPQAGRVQVQLFDGIGRRVRVMNMGFMASGDHTMVINVAGLRAGAYTLLVGADGHTQCSGSVLIAR